jgi:hypothetical protein
MSSPRFGPATLQRLAIRRDLLNYAVQLRFQPRIRQNLFTFPLLVCCSRTTAARVGRIRGRPSSAARWPHRIWGRTNRSSKLAGEEGEPIMPVRTASGVEKQTQAVAIP